MSLESTVRLLALNRGLMSPLALARVDLKRTSLAAEEMVNWIPRVLGPMSLRPGMKYLGSTLSNGVARNIPFIYSASSQVLLEMSDLAMRVRVSDELLTRPAVSTVITNGTFDVDLTGWSDADEAGAVSQRASGADYMELLGTTENAAVRTQTVSVALADRGIEHALRIVVARGPVVIRVGSTLGDDDYVSERTLRTGTHSLAFTPTEPQFYIRLQNARPFSSYLDSIEIEAAGIVSVPTSWTEHDVGTLRYAQSADVMFVACEGQQQRRIERWSDRSWSVVLYGPEDGPFRLINTSSVTLTPSALSGDITLTASKPIFRASHAGALFRLASTGQSAQKSATGADQFTDPILINGAKGQRDMAISISGTWVGTVTLQYSVGEPGSWIDNSTWTGNVARNYEDELDGQIIYYRLGIKAGDYTSGTAELSLSSESGTTSGVVRVTAFVSQTVVQAQVLDNLGGIDATDDWWEGAWSDRRGWPSAVCLYEGRLWWFGKGYIWGSESDAFEDFDDETEGDSGPILRTIGEGPVDSINWALPLTRLMIGTADSELIIRSSSFDEPITPTNFAIKPASTQGSVSGVMAVRIDSTGVFVQRSGQRVYLMGYDSAAADYTNEDATQLVPDMNEVGLTHIAVQRKPDTRVHCLRADGKVALLVFDKVENVLAWCLIETDGVIEDIAVLPGTGEDDVYYIVRRTIDGQVRRYVEKLAKESLCRGGGANHQADSYLHAVDYQISTINTLQHLEGCEVIVWADGKDIGTRTVVGGTITLPAPSNEIIVGLYYEARFKSMKQGISAAVDVPLNQRKRIDHIGLVLHKTHKNGLEYGPDYDHLDPLPLIEAGEEVDADQVWDHFDADFMEFDGEWTTDARVCLVAKAPRPCTVLAIQVLVKTNPR